MTKPLTATIFALILPTITAACIPGSSHGYYHLEDKRIAIDEGMSEIQTLKTAIHEIAHAKLHDIDLNAPENEQQPHIDRRTREVEAESVAYEERQLYTLDKYFQDEEAEPSYQQAGKKITPKLLLEAIRTLPEEKRKAIPLSGKAERETPRWKAS